MEPLNGQPASPPASQPAPTQGPPNTPPAQSAPPASAPGSGPGIAGGAALPAGAGNPSGSVAAPANPNANGQQAPAAPVNPYAGLDPAAQQQMLQWRQQAEQFQRYQHLIPLGYRAYQQAGAPGQPQQQPNGQPQAPQTNVFGLPTNFDFNLLNYVSRDPQSGQLVALPGGPPDAAIQVQRYQETLQKAQRDFWQNPEQFLGQIIEKRAQAAAEKAYAERFQGHEQAQQAQSILQQNAGWMFEAGPDGRQQMQFDPATGQHKPVLSQFGRLYAQAVASLESQGVRDTQTQHRFALAQVQNIAYQAQLRQQQAPAQGQQAAQGFVNQAAVAPPGVIHPPAQTVNPSEPPAGFSLKDRMKALLSGMTEEQFQTQFRAGAA